MPLCAMCSSPPSSQCSRCKSVHYCSPAHQKEDWPAHKIQCPRLAQEALSAVLHPCDEELLLRITTCLAQNGYHKEVGVMVQLNKAFWINEQIWDAFKDVPGKKGRTRLMHASWKGDLGRVCFFLDRGARLNRVCNIGITALMGACHNGNLEVVRKLCERGCNVNASTAGPSALMPSSQRGYTALMAASKRGHLETVRELIGRDVAINAATKNNGMTAVMWASGSGHLEVVRALHLHGANLKAVRSDGKDSVGLSFSSGNLDVMNFILDHGGNEVIRSALEGMFGNPYIKR